LVDLNLPDVNVLELIREMRREWPKLPIMAVSAYGDDAEVLGDVVKMLGADKMIVKPLAADKWAEIVRRVRRFREAGGTALPDF
jgi:DNA-binding response OmpR family regulator